MIALIDNYDSFTYNIFQVLSDLTDEEIRVIRNDEIDLAGLQELNPDRLIISPGPGRPEDSGVSIEALKAFAGKVPIMGVCLGHQAMGYAFGGKIVQAQRIVHGKTEPVAHDARGLFRGLSPHTVCTRYHSLAVEEASLPDCFEVTSRTPDGEVMGIRHKDFIMEGVQFHPESIGSDEGRKMLANFLRYKRGPVPGKELLTKLLDRKDLTREEAADFMDELTEGTLNDAYTAAILTALNAKGIAPEEVAGCAGVLKAKKKKVHVECEPIDIVGTGGDELGTFNISSFSALVAAACGVHVAKHGNRAVSSKSGSADFYRELGINLNLSPEKAAELVDKERFAFLFAPQFHAAMRFAAPVRRAMGIKTIMNLLGPLVNPAETPYQLVGVYKDELCPIIARAAHMLGVKRVMAVHSFDGLDELTLSAKNRIFFIDENGNEEDYVFDPAAEGLPAVTLEQILGGTPAENAERARNLLAGKGEEGIKATCALNAGAALFVCGQAESIKDGFSKAMAAIESGKVAEQLDRIANASQVDA
ncbi:MAG: bifunctional anthranilate synthase component II/anthranilate phosphoribosyltransferase [Spirochaetales bacterium]|nr:bifunctional anthranilate synthase component II/anthranilate phosphoribosyltransferase [Spirochaetales bacterium]